MTEEPEFLLDRLKSNAENHPSRLAIAFVSPAADGGQIQDQRTYQELEDETSSLAARLLQSKLKPGDRVVLVYPPSLNFMIAFLACLKAGITAVPVFPPHPLRRDTLTMFAKIVQSCDTKIALTDTSYNHQKQLASIRERLTTLRRGTSWPDSLQWIVTDKKSSSVSAPPTRSSVQRSEIAFLQFTSGSTSDPKGVMITHGNLAHNLTIITNELQASTSTVVVSWLPQYHDMGLIGSYLGVLYCGGTGYYMSPLSFLQRPMLWMEAVSKYKATHLQAPNFAFKLTARKYKDTKLDLSSVQHIINAAEPVDAESLQVFYNAFGKFGLKRVIFPTYGLAEHTVFVCSGGTQILHVNKHELEVNGRVVKVDTNGNASSTLVGCGYPSRQKVDVRIVDNETFQQLKDDTVGEIWIHSDSKAAGYYGKPEESKHDFDARLADDDSGTGYLRTGDLGFMHEDELFICGRLKDLIIVGGRNYYPQDLEATAEASTDLIRLGCSAAFTIDPVNNDEGEEVALVMELKEVPDDAERICGPLASEVRAAINQEHSLGLSAIAFLKPRTVPKTSSGKIARAWCRKGYNAGTLQVVYHKSFKVTAPLEIEQTTNESSQQMAAASTTERRSAETIRALPKEKILEDLRRDLAKVGSIPPDTIEKKVPLVTMLDSLTLSQFKGMLETSYWVKISDEYLFRESTTLQKLVEVVKLGYAPDDGDNNAANVTTTVAPGQARGLAGALGCPPGVVCVIL